MNMPKREVKNIIYGEEARAKLLSGAEKMYEAVSSTYGVAGNNVILGFPYGDSTLTRDGVTVAKRVILKDRAEDNAAQILKQASEKTNRTAGDGTTATVVLARNLFKRGNKLVAAGESGMVLRKQITEDSKKVIEFLKASAEDSKDHLLEVATVSSGDPAVGALIADTLEDIGTNGGVTIREQAYPTVDVEKVNGYYFNKGCFYINQQVEYSKPLIFVTQKQLASHADIIPLLSRVVNGSNKNLVIIGEVRPNSDASNTLLLNIMENKLQAVVIPPPAFSEEGLPFMQDVALYVGSKLFMSGDNIENVKTDETYFGTAERVVVTQDKAIIFNGNGAGEDIEARIETIKEAIKIETGAHAKDNLEQRLSKLSGKVAIINVGGSTPTEMEELRYRVEDGIEATKSAMADGVLVGGATMLVRAAQLDISQLFKDALLDTFRKLFDNAAEPADFRLEQVRRAKDGFGFNLRNMTEDPIDLRKEGIWDAARSVIQTVENATSAAGSLLTVGVIVGPIDEAQDAKEV